MGCDQVFVAVCQQVSVSIHAPVWGATRNWTDVQTVLTVSIHAPVWGATWASPKNNSYRCFNPRTRVGCDTIKDLVFEPSGVSIHAPVWGATRFIELMPHIKGVSIHAPVWGATYYADDLTKPCLVSIHAPVWGATN